MAEETEWRGVATEEKEQDLTVGASALLRKRSRDLLFSLIRPHSRTLKISIFFMLLDLGAWLAEPLILGDVIDRVADGDRPGLIRGIVILVGITGINFWAWKSFMLASGQMGQDVLFDLRRALFGKFQKLSLSFHEKYTSGRVVARLTSDIDALSELLQTGLREVVTNVLAILGIIIILFAKNWRLALVSLLSFPLVLLLTWWFRKHSERAYRAVRNAVALVIVFYNESLGGIRAGQAFRREPRNKNIFENLTATYRDANTRSSQLAAAYGPGVRLLGRLTNVGVLLYGAVLFRADAITIGTLIGFVWYMNRFFGPLQDLSQFYNVFQAASAALEKLAGVLEEPDAVPDPADPTILEQPSGEIKFDHVTFSYRDDKVVLHDVDLVVPSGQTVALVGQTGAGKSTMAKLIARFYDPTSGAVSLDGVDLRQVSEEQLRRSVVVVTQESFLFSGTVADNIGFGKPEAPREQIEAAAAAIGAHGFISSLPDGYDTDVKKRGGRLSAGQRQLIAFARAFLADPRVLILDEATSSLDIPTERLVQHALRTLLADRTAFIIAHRLTTVEIADRVLVIDDGRVVEDGSPQELIGSGGRYADLHDQWLESLAG